MLKIVLKSNNQLYNNQNLNHQVDLVVRELNGLNLKKGTIA